MRVSGMQVQWKCIITQAVDEIEDKIQQEMLTNVGKKEDGKSNKKFP